MADEYFTQIKNELIRSTKLTPHEKAVLSVLLSYGTCKEIFIGQSKLAKESNMSRKTVNAAVKSLESKKLITTRLKADRSTLVYKLNSKTVVTLSNNVVTESDRGCNPKLQGVVTESDTSNKRLSNKSIEIKKSIKKVPSDDKIPYKEILDYLNQKAKLSRGYKPGNGNNKFISGRWSDGFNLADFKTVIDIKCKEWIGTDMAKYLRPKTLFTSDNFQSYLNQPVVNEEPARTGKEI